MLPSTLLSPSPASFLRGHGFAGQRGLLDIEVARLQEPSIGGDQIPGGEPNEISGDNFMALHFLPRPIAQHSRGQANVFSEVFDGALRTVGLHEIDRYSKRDHDKDDCCVRPLSQNTGR